MSDLNKIINEQRERIAKLEQENALLLVKALPECNYEGLQERIAELSKRAEAAERERDEADAEANQLYDLAQSLEVCSEYLKINFANRKTHLAKFAIEQQIKALESLVNTTKPCGKFGAMHVSDSEINRRIKNLRQQLSGGELWID